MSKKSFLSCVPIVLFCVSVAYAENILNTGSKSQPITINGDVVEYSADSQEVTATGNVEIISGDTKLTCRKLTVNTQTKEGTASGKARLEDSKGIIEGEKLIYNFQTKTGTVVDAQFRASPYFGKARNIDKESEKEFVAHYGYATTCSFNRPHYRISSKQINIRPKELIQTKDDYLYLGPVPIMYLAAFNQMFDEPMMHVSVLPGKRKDWGPYLLSVSRFNLTNNVEGRAYLDYRDKLGWAEGFGLNYVKTAVGSGDFKFYYTDESTKSYSNSSTVSRSAYQRYFMRLRHKWDIDKQTNLVAEVYKITDQKRKLYDPAANILKDYFYREFEKDEQPLSYALFHHSFTYSSFDLLLQKRTNNWFDQLDKMPLATFTLPSIQVGNSPFYFENNSTFGTFNKKYSMYPRTADDLTVTRLDTTNKISIPMRVAFFRISPFVQVRETVYDKGVNGSSTLPARSTFYSGAEVSTKFYRLFDVKTNALGLDLNGLRHVITPSISYSYNPEPTTSSNKLPQIDGVDMLTSSNAAALELSNKLQTKRKDKDGKEVSVDFVDFKINTTYAFAPRIAYGTTPIVLYNNTVVDTLDPDKKNKLGAGFSDFLFRCKILPYAWMRIEADATYKHSGVSSDTDHYNYNHFSTVNYDINFDFAPERSFGLGQRYQRKGQSQITASFQWRLNPKWKISMYERFNLKDYLDTSISPNVWVGKTSLEQQFTLTRNLHCWDVDFTLDTRKNSGTTIYVMFRLKAFPENEFGFNQSYNEPKSGAQ
ncbi:MAG: LPS assembly protein LptD [Candidatus Omnitrophica bacterium]|nr:LPS assembly protein LptD [Candidatus Omnitrophota bacterium]